MLSTIDKNLVFITDKPLSKKKVLEKLVELLYANKRIIEKDKFLKEVFEREKIQSTGIGNEVAIPHAKSEYVKTLSVAICIAKKGIDFDSLDKKPVKIVFLIAAPSESVKVYLQVVAKIARILRIEKWRQKFISAESPESIIEIFNEFNRHFPDRLKIHLKNGKVLLK